MVAEDPLRVAAGFLHLIIEAVSRLYTASREMGKAKGIPDYNDPCFRKRLPSRGQIPFQRQSGEAGLSREQGTDGPRWPHRLPLEFSHSSFRFFFLPPFL